MEMEKLIELLENEGIPFEITNDNTGHPQVWYPNKANVVCDAICNNSSNGHEQGLLEIMGLVEEGGDDVEGYLTAQEIFERIQEHYDN